MSKIAFYILGAVLVVLGVTLVLRDWLYIRMVFRGVIGPLLAVVGMVVLVLARGRKTRASCPNGEREC